MDKRRLFEGLGVAFIQSSADVEFRAVAVGLAAT